MAGVERATGGDRAGGTGTLEDATVRSLASFRGESPVVSLYLDVDGRRRPAREDVERAAQSLFRRARRTAESLGADVAAGVDADLAGIGARLGDGIDRREVRGLAFFASEGDGMRRVIELPVPVRDHVDVGDHPDVTPLVEVLEKARRYLLVLVDRQACRLLRARLGRVEEERAGPADPLERQVDTDVEVGSWERRHQEAALRHLRRVAAAVADEVEEHPADTIIIGGSPEAVDGLIPLLPGGLADRAVPRRGTAMRAGRAEVRQVLAEADAEFERRREEALVEQLGERIGTGRGAGGLEATLDALSDGRVATLVVRPGWSTPGSYCPQCGHLGAGTRPCSRCGAATEPVDDVVDAAIDRALAQDAAVEFCTSDALDAVGGMAALERY